MTKVSIIIPVYNTEKFIAQTIESALNQTWKNIELIIVDDGSTDKSYEVAKKYAAKNVKILNQPNTGAAKARNRGIENATGSYIQFLDADDILPPDKIEKQITKLFESPHNAICSCTWAKFEKEVENAVIQPEKVWKSYSNPIDWLTDSWEGGGMMQTACWLLPKSVIEKAGLWNESLSLNDDGEFFCRVILNCSEIVFCNEAKVYYRVNVEDSLSRQRSQKAIDSAFQVIELYEKHILGVANTEKVRHALMKNYLFFLYEHYPKPENILKTVKTKIKNLGYNHLERIGGKNFQTISKFIGVENALKLRALL